VEDLSGAAVKEEAIELKLRGVGEQWGQEAFSFADHKQRGAVILKVGGDEREQQGIPRAFCMRFACVLHA
jgi:hypothetical protein